MSRPIRVAMVGLRAPWGAEGGVEQVVAALSPRLVRLGCEVTVYCRARYNPLGPGLHQGVRLVNLDTVYTKHLEAIVHTASALPRAARSADVVHVHATGPALLSWIPRLARRATVVTVHGLDWQRDKWGPVARAALKAGAWCAGAIPDRLIVVGQHLQDHYRDNYGIPSSFLPNGVDPIPVVPLAASGIPGLESRRFLLFVGRLVPEKGLLRLIERYRAAAIDLPLVIVGGAPYADEHVRRLKRDAPPGVIFTGSRFGPERDALYSHARAFCYPSRVEGFPVAPLEAMAAGLPLLLSDIPPHRELIGADPGEDPDAPVALRFGWRVPDRGWVAALRAVAAAPEAEFRAAGEAGRALVLRDYAWDRIAAETLEIYRSALAEAGRG